jgi:hypothetical protein
MKKIISTLVFTAVISTFTFAQEVPAAVKSAAKEESPEQTKEEVDKAYALIASFNQKANELKKNELVSAEEKEAAKKTISKEKTEALKKLMGEDRYKLYNEVRKKQKEVAKEAKGE